MHDESLLLRIAITFTTNALIWLTMAGMAVRALKIDFDSLEKYLKGIYLKADGFDFNPVEVFVMLSRRLLTSIYGRTFFRRFVTTVCISCAVNIYTLHQHFMFWDDNKHTIELSIVDAISNIDREYFSIASTAEGRKLINKAFLMVVTQASASYIYNDDTSTSIRKKYTTFHKKYREYILSANITYFDALDRYFGNAYSSTWSLDILVVVFVIISISGFDLVSIYATAIMVQQKTHTYVRVCCIIAIILCSFFSFVGYSGFMQGFDDLSVISSFVIIICFLLYIISILLISHAPPRYIIIDRYYASAILPVCAIIFFLLNGRMYFMDLSKVMYGAELIGSNGVVLSLLAAYQILLVISIAIVTFTIRVFLGALRTIILGQILGASVLSGATFFFGFITAATTTTTTAVTLAYYLL